MILQHGRRTILVLGICASATVVPTQRSAIAQSASANAGGTPNVFFQALKTIDTQQNAIAATRNYAVPAAVIATPHYVNPAYITPAYRPNVAPGSVQSRPVFSPATPSGQTPSAFYRALRAIDSQQNTPYSVPAIVTPASAASPAPSPWSTQPIGTYRTVSDPHHRNTADQIAATNTPRNASILNTDYWLSYPQNAWRIISAPYNFETSDWLTAGGIAAGTAILLLADKGINDTWRDDIRSGALDDFLDVMEKFGDSQTVIFTALGGYALGELIGTERDKEAGLLIAQSFVLSAGLTQVFKFTFRRDRPDDSRDDQYSFFSSDSSKTNSSFPSGHATNAFSMAAVLTNVYDESVPWLGWVLYPVATMTSLARINNERHWGSDVFLGGALGYFIGRMVVHFSPFRGNRDVSIAPMSDSDVNGLRIVHKI